MSTDKNSRPSYPNRIADYFNDGIVDYVAKSEPSDVTVSREFFADYKSLVQELRDLYLENTELREAVRALDLDIRGKVIDVQAARFELAKVYGAKLKKLRERASR